MAKVKEYEFGNNNVVGYMFFCPGCEEFHPINTVRLDGHDGWDFNGDINNPTFSPSILWRWKHPKGYTNDNPAPLGYDGEYVEECCHSFVRDGKIEFLNDCTHRLAGKTVELPDIEPTKELKK